MKKLRTYYLIAFSYLRKSAQSILYYVVLIHLLIGSSTVSAQTKSLNSLKRQITVTPNQKKAKLFNNIASSYFNYSLDSGLFYALRAADMATNAKQYSQLATAYSFAGQYYYYQSNYISSIKSFNKSYDAAVAANDKSKTIHAINNVANVLIDQGKTAQAIERYEKVVALSTQYDDKKNLALGYNNLAYVYRASGNYDQAAEYLFKKIKIDEKQNNKDGLANGFQQLGMIYLYKKDYKNAFKYLEPSYNLFAQLGNLRNIAVAKSLLGDYYFAVGQKAKAVQYLKEAVALADKMQDKRSLAIFQSTLSGFLKENSNYIEAEDSYKKAIDLHEKIGLNKTLPNVLVGLGQTLYQLNKLDEAKKYFDSGLHMAKQQNALAEQRDAYDGLTEYYIKKNDVVNALINKQNFIKLKDSLLNENNNKIINDLNIKYETEKKEVAIQLLNSQNYLQQTLLQKNKLQLLSNELELDKKNLLVNNQSLALNNQNLLIQKSNFQLLQNEVALKTKEQKINVLNLNNKLQKSELQKKNIILVAAFIFLLAAVLAAWLLINRFRLKQKARLQVKLIEQQDLAAKAVINAEENERQRMSATLHDGLGQLLSVIKMNMQTMQASLNKDTRTVGIYNSTMSLMDDSIKEMRSVSHQIMLPNNIMRVGLANALKSLVEKIDSNKLKIHLNIEGINNGIDQNIQLMMYRIFQESINNVIKHAQATVLDISVMQDSGVLHATIEDNGVGFHPENLLAAKGIGLENIKTRVHFLKGQMDIDSSPGKGTLLAIHVPVGERKS